jgi:hypothetical protein
MATFWQRAPSQAANRIVFPFGVQHDMQVVRHHDGRTRLAGRDVEAGQDVSARGHPCRTRTYRRDLIERPQLDVDTKTKVGCTRDGQ